MRRRHISQSWRSATNIIVQVDRVIKAVQSTVPQHMWGEIVEKLEQQEGATTRQITEPRDEQNGAEG